MILLMVLTILINMHLIIIEDMVYRIDKSLELKRYKNNIEAIYQNNRLVELEDYSLEECEQLLINICKVAVIYCGSTNPWRFLSQAGLSNMVGNAMRLQSISTLNCGNIEAFQRFIYINSTSNKPTISSCDNYFYDISNYPSTEKCAISEFLRR